jgi:predicted nucleic acid-binding protein
VIFVDTSFWIALRLRRDSRHREALALLDATSSETLITSNHVRGETWTFLRARDSHQSAVTYLEILEESSRVRVERVGDRLEDEALRWLRRHDERAYSFVDATSFALMRALHVTEALAFDGDFSAVGFVERRQ